MLNEAKSWQADWAGRVSDLDPVVAAAQRYEAHQRPAWLLALLDTGAGLDTFADLPNPPTRAAELIHQHPAWKRHGLALVGQPRVEHAPEHPLDRPRL